MENKMALSCKEIAERLKGLREMMEISPEEMAKVTNMTVDQYLALSMARLRKCASMRRRKRNAPSLKNSA